MFHLVRSMTNKQQNRRTGRPMAGPRRKSEHPPEAEKSRAPSRDRSSFRGYSGVPEVTPLPEDTRLFSRSLLLRRTPLPQNLSCSRPSRGPLLSRDFYLLPRNLHPENFHASDLLNVDSFSETFALSKIVTTTTLLDLRLQIVQQQISLIFAFSYAA